MKWPLRLRWKGRNKNIIFQKFRAIILIPHIHTRTLDSYIVCDPRKRKKRERDRSIHWKHSYVWDESFIDFTIFGTCFSCSFFFSKCSHLLSNSFVSFSFRSIFCILLAFEWKFFFSHFSILLRKLRVLSICMAFIKRENAHSELKYIWIYFG